MKADDDANADGIHTKNVSPYPPGCGDMITVKYWLGCAMLKKNFKSNVIFNYSLWEAAIKLYKCFTKFIISIVLFR